MISRRAIFIKWCEKNIFKSLTWREELKVYSELQIEAPAILEKAPKSAKIVEGSGVTVAYCAKRNITTFIQSDGDGEVKVSHATGKLTDEAAEGLVLVETEYIENEGGCEDSDVIFVSQTFVDGSVFVEMKQEK